MATSFLVKRPQRSCDAAMFTDLGFPNIILTATAIAGEIQVDLVETLTLAQIQRARVRMCSMNTYHEGLLLQIPNAIDTINTWNALTPIQKAVAATAVSMVNTLAQDMKGVLLWIGKDALL